MTSAAAGQTSILSVPAKHLGTVALVGNPNTGKSSLFNALCGMNARIGNFPGVTVEKKVGRFVDDGHEIQVIDLPGTYSLSARSMDEKVSVDVLLSRQVDVPHLDAVVVIIDATNIERNLYLFSQVRDLGLPVLLVLNMWDRVAESGVKIDDRALEKRLGLPVVKTSANRRMGIDETRSAIVKLIGSQPPTSIQLFPSAFQEECLQLAKWLNEQGQKERPDFLHARLLLDTGGATEQYLVQQGLKELPKYLSSARERLAKQDCKVPSIETKVRYGWVRQQLAGIVTRTESDTLTVSDRIDRVLTHRWWGMIAFVALMFVIFQSIYSIAEPAALGVEYLQGWVSSGIEAILPSGTLRSLLVDGIVAGVGSVITFLPQILLLFFFIGILEDCGYMARAAFVMDKLMTRVGLSGKSFLPLMSSFACAVPGIMATRVIENRRDRMVTILVAPLMSCSARLPVYFLMVTAFVPPLAYAGGWIKLQPMILLAMQAIGAMVAIPIAWLLKRFVFPGDTPPFVMELPSYKVPSSRVVFHRVWERGLAFLVRAGTLIFCTAILVWAAGYFPGDHSHEHVLAQSIDQFAEVSKDSPSATLDERKTRTDSPSVEELRTELSAERARLIEESLLGRTGKSLEPIFRPLGWDWRIGVGVIASFPAREVIIATLGTIYSLGGEVDEQQMDTSLKASLQSAKWPDGRPVFTIPVAISIMVFFALCAQCSATLMVIRRETNSWRWPIFSFAYMTSLAYIGAMIVYQCGTWLMGAPGL